MKTWCYTQGNSRVRKITQMCAGRTESHQEKWCSLFQQKKKKVRLGSLIVAMCDSITHNVFVKNFLFSVSRQAHWKLWESVNFGGVILEEVGYKGFYSFLYWRCRASLDTRDVVSAGKGCTCGASRGRCTSLKVNGCNFEVYGCHFHPSKPTRV